MLPNSNCLVNHQWPHNAFVKQLQQLLVKLREIVKLKYTTRNTAEILKVSIVCARLSEPKWIKSIFSLNRA